MNARSILGGVLSLAGLALAVAILTPEQQAVAEARDFTSSSQCAECHPDAYAEWSASEHANAWTGADVRELSNDFSNQDCIDCHAPLPIFETGIGQRVQPRTLRRVEGVDCISCHQLPDGGMAGGVSNDTVACRPVERIELTDAKFCAGCHNQHLTMDQWRDSRWAAEGVDCVDCHMPYRDGDQSLGRDHTMHGGTNLAILQAAVALRGELEDGAWVVEVENVGVGHSFPTDERSRAGDVFWRPLDGDGGSVGAWRHLHRFRSPYRQETGIEESLLLVHETRRMPVLESEITFLGSGGITEGVPVGGPIEVALFYKRSPYYTSLEAPDPDAEATLVHRITLIP